MNWYHGTQSIISYDIYRMEKKYKIRLKFML